MKKTESSETDDMLPEYNFDYTKARTNRFIKADKKDLTIILDPDVAKVFSTSESVNKILRAIIAAMPENEIKEETAH